ncbi:hypothetical protein [Halobacterium sp. R2-5]|uniref:hypothetical protein n=1 Tax=Halobacterium sp. R2-5 TaxID=2715751 RepID=UPI001421F6CA|nr:hypothetical protein [Halobacterium sp. R2-5]NIB99991.1 hypothetical protein [Halobacterium sp. R2-5]
MTEQTLKDVSQRNPAAPDGVNNVFRRGPIVAADGGERAAEPEKGEQKMKDVDQTPPTEDDEGANPVWERGGEPVADEDGRDE